MGLRIQNNVEAFNAHRQLTGTAAKAAKAMEKLSSGYRVNRAADDAAGLAISEKMRAQIGGLAQAQRNAQDAVSLVQTGEGALNEVHSMLQRVRDLKVQYSSGMLSDEDKKAIAAEVQQLGKEVNDIAGKTEFNGLKLLDGTSFTFTVGANSADTVAIATVALSGTNGVADLVDVGSAGTARRLPPRALNSLTVDEIDTMIKNVSTRPFDVRRGAEPPRAPPEQPRDLPGEPGRVREPDPRRGHGQRDGQLHEAPDPAAGRHEHARAGQPGPAGRPFAPALRPYITPPRDGSQAGGSNGAARRR